MFALPNGDFCKMKTLQHILGLWTCSFVSSQLTLSQRYSLPVWQFLGKNLNFREFKT
jgi:hypothetical protein